MFVTETLSLFSLLAAAVLLVWIAAGDARALTIKNRDVALLLLAALAFLGFAQPGDLLARVLMAAVLFAVTFLFWLKGALGAGDVKLFGAVGLLIPTGAAMGFALALAGIAVGLVALVRLGASRGGLAGLAARGRVPFGVPIAGATLAVLPFNL
ncbi:MAG: prepilin peptidase [Pseudomonadota bacterium]